MVYTRPYASYLFIIVCLYSSRSSSVAAALKLECPDSFEQEEGRSFKAISIFNKSSFSFLGDCQKNLSLTNVSVEMICRYDEKSDCQTHLRFSWAFESKDARDLLKEVTLTLLEFSPIAGRRQQLNCFNDDYDDYHDDDDDDYTQSSSLEIFVMDYDCCNVDQAEHGYYATLKATYDDLLKLPSCKFGTSLTLMPTSLTKNEDDAITSSRTREFSRGGDSETVEPQTNTIFIPTVVQEPFSFVRGAIIISFGVVVCVVVVIVVYLCIRRGSHNRRRLTERENSSQPFDMNNGLDIENFKGSSYLHNCPHCINETIRKTIPDQHGFLDSSGSDVEEGFRPDREEQLDSGLCSGGPMFISAETGRNFSSQF